MAGAGVDIDCRRIIDCSNVTVVLNPAKRRSAKARRSIAAAVSARGWPAPEFLHTTRAEPGEKQARQALRAGSGLVLVVGGDGTVRKVAGALAGSGVPMGVVPVGAANLFARNLGLRPRRLRRAVAIAFDGDTRHVDIGRARIQFPAGKASAEQAFLVMAGIGRDAETVAEASQALKERIGWPAYFAGAVRQMGMAGARLSLAIDSGEPLESSPWSVLFGNAPRIPLGIPVFPRAALGSGALEVLQVDAGRRLDWPKIALGGLLRATSRVSALTYSSATTAVVRPLTPMRVQLDGDVVPGVAEVGVRVEPAALSVKVPWDPGQERRRWAKLGR